MSKEQEYNKLLNQQEQAKKLYESISNDVKAFEKLHPDVMVATLNESKYFDNFINKIIVIKRINYILILKLATLSFKLDFIDFYSNGNIVQITNNREVSIVHEETKAVTIPIKNYKDNLILWDSLDEDTKKLVYSSINPSLQLHRLLTENIGEDY